MRFLADGRDLVEEVIWSVRHVPDEEPPLRNFHFDAEHHDAEPARAVTDRWWDIYTDPTWRLPVEPNETRPL
ncbi:hypothetical protein ACFV98_42170 [Streptomyces violascens]|uniref:hypothetical protein n=1 Tax=Streptomyces violascens TaxID=67381 RepID=UPI00364CE486